jgi:hypothetical protein
MSEEQLPPFPVDEETLRLLSEALSASYRIVDDEHVLIGAEFSVAQLLDFYSGYDESKCIVKEDGWLEYPGQLYTIQCVVRSLIDEVRRLRELGETK